MVDQNTAKYLNDNIGTVLSKALSEMTVQQPNDGVDFLADWLNTYADQEELQLAREEDEKQMLQDRAVTQRREGEKAARREAKVADKTSIQDGYQSLLKKFTDEGQMFKESYWKELVDVTKQYMGAQSVYLGCLDEEGLEGVEPPIIRYTHESIYPGSPSLLQQTLPKMKDAETSTLTYGALTESIPEEEQAAKCLWKPAPPPQPPVPEGEEQPPPPEGPKYLPVAVPCVTDVPLMHYFEMPRLGGYFACPLVYSTYHTQDAYKQAKQFEEEKAEVLRVKAEKAAERQAAIEDAQERGVEEPVFEPEEEQPEKELVLTGTAVKLVLCMDTLGTNTLFDADKYADMMALCDACGACKSRSEIREVDDQAIFAIGQDRRIAAEDVDAGLPSLRETAKLDLQTPQDEALKEIADRGLESDPRKVVEDICYKKFAHLQAKLIMEYYKEHIQVWVKSVVSAQPEVLNVFAAIAFLLGYTRADVYPARKTSLKWPQMKSLVEDASRYFRNVEESNVDIGRRGLQSEQKISSIQALLPPDLNEEKAKEIDPAFEVVWTFLSTAVDYRVSALKQAQAEYEERKKKAEEEEQTFDEPELITIDDDFEGLAA